MIYKEVKDWAAYFLLFCFNLLPLRQNKVMMFSYYGANYSCNPKYITEYMINNVPSEFDIVWAFTDPEAHADLSGVRKVRFLSFKYFYELCTSKIIITNYRMTHLFKKRKQQYYIQTWHSSLRLKQIEKDAMDTLPSDYVKMAIQDAAQCDLVISGCEFSTAIFRKSFWYDGEVFQQGTPRNDLFLQKNTEKKSNIRKSLNITPDKKILLYAPTFRQNNQHNVFDLDVEQITQTLEKRFGGHWVMLVKLHPHVREQSKKILPDKVMDVSLYNDTQELLMIADMLITDYSSLMFDFALTERPCFLYVPDVADYTKGERELYFNLKELPFISVKSNKELITEITNYSVEVEINKKRAFLEQIVSYEVGHASEGIVNRIREVCKLRKGSEMDEAV